MPNDVLENYIVQHIKASGDVINFSWHGGEPTILGLDYFKKIVELQLKYKPPNRDIVNGIQTNGTLLDEDWCSFFREHGFYVGLSLDGPPEIHNMYRLTKEKKSTYNEVIRGFNLLQKYCVYTEILCVVNSYNVKFPLEVYRFFKHINAHHITFLPLIDPKPCTPSSVSSISVSAEAWGKFLCSIFDKWVEEDIGKVKVQIFEEALRTAFNQEHSLCIFRPTCGEVPVLEHNGDFYSCDHFVDSDHLIGNLREMSLVELLDNPKLRVFGKAKLLNLPRYCKECTVRDMCNGECPKNRIIMTPEGEPGLNHLCEGYKQFFIHCKPFITEVATLWSQQKIKY